MIQQTEEILQVIIASRKKWESKLGGNYDDLMKARIYENEYLGEAIATILIRKEALN